MRLTCTRPSHRPGIICSYVTVTLLGSHVSLFVSQDLPDSEWSLQAVNVKSSFQLLFLTASNQRCLCFPWKEGKLMELFRISQQQHNTIASVYKDDVTYTNNASIRSTTAWDIETKTKQILSINSVCFSLWTLITVFVLGAFLFDLKCFLLLWVFVVLLDCDNDKNLVAHLFMELRVSWYQRASRWDDEESTAAGQSGAQIKHI